MARVINTPDGRPVSENNPFPVKVLGGGGGVDPDNFYTKEESDERYQEKGDYATTEQLNAKVDDSELEALKSEVAELKELVEGEATE